MKADLERLHAQEKEFAKKEDEYQGEDVSLGIWLDEIAKKTGKHVEYVHWPQHLASVLPSPVVTPSNVLLGYCSGIPELGLTQAYKLHEIL